MSDLIRREDALNLLHYHCDEHCSAVVDYMENIPAVDAVEVMQKEAVDYGYLADWYIRSVTNDPPVWTEEHIEELFNDFYLVPKDNGERREGNAVD